MKSSIVETDNIVWDRHFSYSQIYFKKNQFYIRLVCIDIENDPILTETVKATLSIYASDPDIVSVINVNYLEILVAVWNRIVINENSVEIKLRLNQEIMDCKFGAVCFTGKISRLVNCLSGFDDIVDVRISDAEQIGIIISLVKERLTTENMYTVDLHKSIVRERLHELNYPDDIIDTWISFIVVENDEEQNVN